MSIIYSVGRVRAIHPKNGMGFITHQFNIHYVFYFSNFCEFENHNGFIKMGGSKYFAPNPGEFIIFEREGIKFPNSEENQRGWKPRIEKWSTPSSYRSALSDKFLRVVSDGTEVFIGGLNSFGVFMENNTHYSEDELEIHFV